MRALSKYDCLRANKSSSAWGIKNVFNLFLTNSNLYKLSLSMFKGVEVRVPFLDLDFLDYAVSIDPAEKMTEHPVTGEKRMEKQ